MTHGAAADAGRVDQDVDGPERLQRAVNHGRNILGHGDIDMHVDGVAQLLGQRLAVLITDVGQHDLGPFIDQNARTLLAHAADGPGDDRHFAFQSQIHVCLLLLVG